MCYILVELEIPFDKTLLLLKCLITWTWRYRTFRPASFTFLLILESLQRSFIFLVRRWLRHYCLCISKANSIWNILKYFLETDHSILTFLHTRDNYKLPHYTAYDIMLKLVSEIRYIRFKKGQYNFFWTINKYLSLSFLC